MATSRIVLGSSSKTEVFQSLGKAVAAFGPEIRKSKIFERAIKQWADSVLEPEVRKQLSGGSVARRSGDLSRRTHVRTEVTNDSINVVVESSGPQASMLNRGGTIRARAGSYLTIPLPGAKDARGVAPPARSFTNTFFARSRAGNLILFRNLQTSRIPSAANQSNIEPLFVLKEKVTIKPTRWADKSLERTRDSLEEAIDKSLNELMDEVIK